MIIRPLRADDTGPLTKMLQALARHHHDEALATPHQIRTACFKTKIAFGQLALDPSPARTPKRGLAKPIGFVLSYDWMNFVRAQRVCHIDLLWVDEAYRRLEVGKSLLRSACQAARKRGCTRVDIEARSDNDAAQSFYSALGLAASQKKTMRYRIQGPELTRFSSKRTR